MGKVQMFNILIFALGAGIMFFLAGRSFFTRTKLRKEGETVAARVVGVAQGRDSAAYVLEFSTAGGSHRLHYPKPPRGKGFAVGSTVTLHYDPQDPEKMYVEGDKAALGAELVYLALGAALLALLFGMIQW